MRLTGKAWSKKRFKGVLGALTKPANLTPLKSQKKAKYNNAKVLHKGLSFDSRKEKDRYIQLLLLESAGKIKDIQTQVRFLLQDKFRKNGRIFRAIYYIADFTYTEIATGKQIVEDVKGCKTQIYLLKLKLFEYKYPELTIVEIWF